jgi:hypothetical protein
MDAGDPPPAATPSKTSSLSHDIQSLLHDEDITDIILIPERKCTATDGNSNDTNNITAVPTIKAILAARSPVFRRMLYGDFRETQSNNQDNVEVKLDYSGRVLQLLVEFCFTDKLESLTNNNRIDSSSSIDTSTTTDTSTTNTNTTSTLTLEQKARLLTNLSGAGHYFDIAKLEEDIKYQLNEMMLAHPSLACAVLDESSKMPSGEELGLIAMERIRAQPKAALLHRNNNNNIIGAFSSTITSSAHAIISGWGEKGGVISLNPSLLEKVIFDDQSTASELTKFLCLKQWYEGCKHEVSLEYYDLLHRKRMESDEILSSRTPQFPKKQLGMLEPAARGRSNSTAQQQHHHQQQPPSPPSKSQNEQSSTYSQHEQRLAIVKQLAEKLDLSLIPASDLSTIVTESKLISTHDLFQAYRLQALNAEQTKSKVFVEGAGLAEVNGTYIQRGVHEGTPMYNKEGVWRDREEVFRLFLCTYSNGNKSWCLSIVPKGKEPGKTTDIDFYECPVSYGKGGGMTNATYGGSTDFGLGVVPSRGWKLVNYGQPPVPKCSLIAGCLEDA